MVGKKLQRPHRDAWALARRQHRLITRSQLLALGYGRRSIEHRLRNGRLHRVRRGVYAVGSTDLTQHGLFMAAVLSCGPDATLSHDSAAVLWDILPWTGRQTHVSVPPHVVRRCTGILVHRRKLATADVTVHHGIPVITPVCALIDLAARHPAKRVERAINTADDLGFTDPERLRSELDRIGPRPGLAPLRRLLDRRTFRMTRSELERRFLLLVRRAGLPMPLTKQQVNGFEVDFYWPELGLVVETDGLRYHRTPQQQARDHVRDHAHAVTDVRYLRFTHDQIAHDPDYVVRILTAVARRLSQARDNPVAVL